MNMSIPRKAFSGWTHARTWLVSQLSPNVGGTAVERLLQTEKDTLWLRLVAALGAAAGLFVYQVTLSDFWVLVLPLVYGVYLGYSLLLRYYLLPRVRSPYFIYGMILVDILAITGIIYVTGGVDSALIILFPVFITYYSIHLGFAGSFFAASVATGGLMGYLLSASQHTSLERGVILSVAMFYIIAISSGYLGQRGLRQEAEKEALQELLNVESGARSLLDVATTLNSTLDFETLLREIVHLSPTITGLPRCVALLLDETHEKLVGKAANVDSHEMGVRRISDVVELLDDSSLARRALEIGQPVAMSSESPWYGELQPPPELRAGSLIAIPLLSQGTRIGVIYSYDGDTERVFSDEELRLAKGFGDVTSLAVANAKLYQEAQAKIATLVEELGDAVQRMERLRGPRPRSVISVNGLEIDVASQKVTLSGHSVDLSPTEFRLLYALAETPGVSVSQDILFRKTWGDIFRGHSNSVDVYIHRLRRKLERNAAYPTRIVTVRGAGYRLMKGD